MQNLCLCLDGVNDWALNIGQNLRDKNILRRTLSTYIIMPIPKNFLWNNYLTLGQWHSHNAMLLCKLKRIYYLYIYLVIVSAYKKMAGMFCEMPRTKIIWMKLTVRSIYNFLYMIFYYNGIQNSIQLSNNSHVSSLKKRQTT